jgi:hypothetical protein
MEMAKHIPCAQHMPGKHPDLDLSLIDLYEDETDLKLC